MSRFSAGVAMDKPLRSLLPESVLEPDYLSCAETQELGRLTIVHGSVTCEPDHL